MKKKTLTELRAEYDARLKIVKDAGYSIVKTRNVLGKTAYSFIHNEKRSPSCFPTEPEALKHVEKLIVASSEHTIVKECKTFSKDIAQMLINLDSFDTHIHNNRFHNSDWK